MGWNYGDIYDAVAKTVPADARALTHCDERGEAVRSFTWADFTRRTNNLASNFRERGVATGAKVAFYLRNSPAYAEMLAACFKGRLVHVNVNYRYLDNELWYIFDNSDAEVVVYSAEFADHVRALRDRLPAVAHWIEVEPVGREGCGVESFATAFEELAEFGDGAPLALDRSDQDLLFLYTGGTTGMPKGVMWEHESQWHAVGGGASPATNDIAPADLSEHCRNVAELVATEATSVQIACCPLMHGTGLFTAMGTLANGGCSVTLEGTHFDPEQVWAAVERQRATSLAIVGDAFAKPLLNVLDSQPGRFDVSSLVGMISSGIMWSPEVKRGLLQHNDQLLLIDSFGASEAPGFGRTDTTAEAEVEVAKFALGENCKVFTEDHREVAPGSGAIGFVARSGPLPLGYYKDPEKTARTFPTINRIRYAIPGDWCTVEPDGTLTLLGRGSVCINTGGEKVYPEEVEEVLKTHPAVEDALVVGVPDEKWGESVTGVVRLRSGASLEEADLRRHVRERLAGYKTPKRVLSMSNLCRAANGKPDYKAATEHAKRELGIAGP